MKTAEAAKLVTLQDFDLEQFLPYLLNQAAESTSRSFQRIYAEKYGMTRTQWRVLANLGKSGSLTATEICTLSHIEKTKVSRAIGALEEMGALRREASNSDRRAEILSLTKRGQQIFSELGHSALEYNQRLRATLGSREFDLLMKSLRRLLGNASPHMAE